jgi:hypothetical protein
MRMSQVTCSCFAKYFYDTYSKYMTQCAVMTYATSDAIWVMPPLLCTLCSRVIVWSIWVDILWMALKRKLSNSIILFGAMNKISCLILSIIHVYNAGISWLRSGRCDSDHMLDISRRTWLRSEDMTLVVYPDSRHTSRFRSMSQLR